MVDGTSLNMNETPPIVNEIPSFADEERVTLLIVEKSTTAIYHGADMLADLQE